MALAFSLLFGTLGAIVLLNALSNTLFLFDPHPLRRRRAERQTMFAGLVVLTLAGLSFCFAASLIWLDQSVAVALVAWPLILFTVLRATGVITVISRLSTGE